MLGHPGADIGVAAAERVALAGNQVRVVTGFAQQRQVALRFGLGQAQHAQVLQQPGQHQFLQAAQATGLAQLAGGQCAENAALPRALAQVVVGTGAAGQALGDGEAQGKADRGIQAEHGQCLAEVLDAATTGVQRRIGDAQHASAQRHVDGDDVGGGGDVRFRVLGASSMMRRAIPGGEGRLRQSARAAVSSGGMSGRSIPLGQEYLGMHHSPRFSFLLCDCGFPAPSIGLIRAQRKGAGVRGVGVRNNSWSMSLPLSRA